MPTPQILGPDGKPYRKAEAEADRHQLRAKIDAAQSSNENKRHWANADSLGPNSALDTTTRGRLRDRARYEAINNSYARGLVRSLSYDLIGTGPRLQLTIPGATNDDTKAIERSFGRWARVCQLGRKFRIMEKGAARCGEGFGLLGTNDRLRHAVKLDVRLVEPEQCDTPWGMQAEPNVIDGIRYDDFGNPVTYYFLAYHPGETNLSALATGMTGDYEPIDAKQVLHWYEQDRAGQMRGIPRLTSSLPLFAQLRRYTLATLTAAEFAAMLAGVLKTAATTMGTNITSVDDWTPFEMLRGALLTLPDGWEATQFRAEQPTTTYGDFKREILNESGRGPGAPLNVVSGNSSGYNFSSGRLDHLPYQRGLGIDRDEFEIRICDHVLYAWEMEARFAGIVAGSLPPIEEWTWLWAWDPFDSIDPVKDAQADDIRLGNGTASYREILAKQGIDEEEHFDELAREKQLCEDRGLPWPPRQDSNASAPAQAQDTAQQDQADQAQQFESMEQMVQWALDEAGMNEAISADVMDALRPTFAARRRKVNGHRRPMAI